MAAAWVARFQRLISLNSATNRCLTQAHKSLTVFSQTVPEESLIPRILTNRDISCFTPAEQRSNLHNHKQARSIHSGNADLTSCWQCRAPINRYKHDPDTSHPADHFYCQEKDCGALQPLGSSNHFELFRLSTDYDIDNEKLTDSYRKILQRLHPDKSVHLSEQEKLYAENQSTAVNDAFDTLSKPVPRALYLLNLHGLSLEEEDVSLDGEFLMDIMQRNEDVADTDDDAELRKLFDDNRGEINGLIKLISDAFRQKDFSQAKLLISKIKYFVAIEDKIKERTYFH